MSENSTAWYSIPLLDCHCSRPTPQTTNNYDDDDNATYAVTPNYN